MIGKDIPKCCCELDEPVLSSSISDVHGFVVFPVNIDSIEIIILDEISKASGTFCGIVASGGWELLGSKGTDHDFDTIFVISLFEILSDLFIGVTELG